VESKIVTIGNFDVRCHSVNTLVIGSGAASLNAALSLHRMGQDDVIIATSDWLAGTSRNAGSDKQTYYKLSIAGKEADSVRMMAEDLFAGHCMHGDIALCEAQGSVQAFINLVALGVKFPHDAFGSWAGYKTDHDPRARATSAGPYTSRMMFEALSAEVLKSDIKVLDKHHCIALLTSPGKDYVTGAIAINKAEKDFRHAFVAFSVKNIVLGSGGPASMYASSVYPLSQEGSTGMAFRAGAAGQNLTESQFGIASVKFRWNLSGSYQQVMPRYYSAEKDGSGEREFLNDHFPDYPALLRAIFLKGYQWPFDPAKVSGYGSSLIDLLVDSEINEKGRDVFIDFRRNPSWEGMDFLGSIPAGEVRDYLEKSRALRSLPYERLLAMNPAAVSLYSDHGIYLESEPLRIAVCAQHNNGGLMGNIWWESNLRHLFPVGEVNGSHGVYRPGGSALNSGQVGSYRAARYICRKYADGPVQIDDFIINASEELSSVLGLANKWLSAPGGTDKGEILREIRTRMTSCAGIKRSRESIAEAVAAARKLNDELAGRISAVDTDDLAEAFSLADTCLTHFVYLSAIDCYIREGGRSRGSFLVTGEGSQGSFKAGDEGNNAAPGTAAEGELSYGSGDAVTPAYELCAYDRDVEKGILEVKLIDNEILTTVTAVRDIPDQDLWFENVWRDYNEDNWLNT
jgi:succinate dehydrogenase/fumarate reductase flavoprotein subunit